MHGISYNCPYELPENPYNARCKASGLSSIVNDMILQIYDPKTKEWLQLTVAEYLDKLLDDNDPNFSICHLVGKESLTMSPPIPKTITNTKGNRAHVEELKTNAEKEGKTDKKEERQTSDTQPLNPSAP